ncbi:MAG: hypothetical protein Q8K96_11955 [Rubrivivax sp.]|nr:hypothetical protein [Rubrivivax sp.]
MKTVEVEICAITNHDTFTLGRGRNYSAAIEDARRQARFAHSICAMVLTWKSPLIRAYSRPQHRYGAIVPCEAIDPHCAPWHGAYARPAAPADVGAELSVSV